MKKLKLLKRVRINRALESIFDYPLTVIETPMGYGKTTAAKEFLAAGSGPVMWLSFLNSNDTVSFFWDGLTNEIGKNDEQAGMKLKRLGFPSDAPRIKYILSVLNGLDFEKNTVLVIDDFHLVKETQISELICQIVKEELAFLHMVIITRDTSNLDLSELIAKGFCNIISQEVLRFTNDEIWDYCEMAGYKLSEENFAKYVNTPAAGFHLFILFCSGWIKAFRWAETVLLMN